MSGPVDTALMADGDRAELWQNAVSDHFVPLHVVPTTEGLRGRIVGSSVGDLQLRRIAASPHRFERSAPLIRRSDEDYYKVVLGVSGSALLTQDGKSTVVRPGGLALYDSTRPFTFVMDQFYDVMVCMVPKRLLTTPADQLRHATATRIDGGSGSPALLMPFLNSLFARSDEFVAEEADALTLTMASLVDAIVRGRVAPDRLAGEPHFLRALRFIETHIGDPTLCPDAVAAATAVSLSYLQKLFAQHDTSVASHIREVRLQGCWRDLGSPSYAHLPVAAVGERWGFRDPTQLSRAFRARFDTSPAAHRRAAAAQLMATSGAPPHSSLHSDRSTETARHATDSSEERHGSDLAR